MTRTALVLAVINDLSRNAFAWGRCDCCTFALAVARAVSSNPIAFTFAYSSESEARDIVSANPYGLEGLVTSMLGAPCIAAETIDGDPVLLRVNGGTLGVRLGDYAVAKTKRNVRKVSMDHAVCGWRLL